MCPTHQRRERKSIFHLFLYHTDSASSTRSQISDTVSISAASSVGTLGPGSSKLYVNSALCTTSWRSRSSYENCGSVYRNHDTGLCAGCVEALRCRNLSAASLRESRSTSRCYTASITGLRTSADQSRFCDGQMATVSKEALPFVDAKAPPSARAFSLPESLREVVVTTDATPPLHPARSA